MPTFDKYSNSRLKPLQLLLLLLFLLMQWFIVQKPVAPKALPASIPADDIRLVSLAEPALVAKLLGFWLLSYDSQSAKIIPYEHFNYQHLVDWLNTIQTLDPYSDYPSFVASGIFVDVKDPQRIRLILRFIHQAFLQAPALRWRWQARAVMLAKYRLGDQALALSLAQDLRQYTPQQSIPAWARDMEFIILQDVGEFDMALLIVEGLLKAGKITDPNELAFLTQKLKELQEQSR